MIDSRERGVVDLPVTLLLCIFLALLVTGLGLKGLTQAHHLRSKQKSISSFNIFIETISEVAYGEIGKEKNVRLDLYNAEIKVSNKQTQLKIKNEILKVDYLPLPLLKNKNKHYFLRSGVYRITLVGRKNKLGNNPKRQHLVLKITEVSK